jgi:hypothetical protein
MSARIPMRFTNSDASKNLTALFFQSPDAEQVIIRVYNDSASATSANYLTVIRGDLIESGYTLPLESDDVKNGLGEELASESWLEASLNGVTWAAVDSWTNKFSIGGISAGSFATIYLRLNPPATYDSKGMIAFALRLLTR